MSVLTIEGLFKMGRINTAWETPDALMAMLLGGIQAWSTGKDQIGAGQQR